MASEQQAGGQPAALALLRAIVRRDLPAVKAALAASAELSWEGVPALPVCALCDFPEPVQLLVDAGGWPHVCWACLSCRARELPPIDLTTPRRR